LFSTIILPGLMLFLIYAIMGSSFSSLIGGDTEYYNRVYLINSPDSFEEYVEMGEENKISYTIIRAISVDLEALKNDLKEDKIDLIVVFDEDFDSKIEENLKPNIEVYGNAVSSNSTTALNK